MMNNYGIKRNTIRIDFLIKLAKINFNKVKKNRWMNWKIYNGKLIMISLYLRIWSKSMPNSEKKLWSSWRNSKSLKNSSKNLNSIWIWTIHSSLDKIKIAGTIRLYSDNLNSNKKDRTRNPTLHNRKINSIMCTETSLWGGIMEKIWTTKSYHFSKDWMKNEKSYCSKG